MSEASNDKALKQEVSNFYNQIGWQMQNDGFYQNARYEDLRPISHEYIHRCHLRINRHLQPNGDFLLDAGSGPVQYPEYLTYSENYKYRVCLDISIKALEEARYRLQDKGLYVVADVANLPFRADAFDGLVSLHTLHHIPTEQYLQAYQGAWTSPELMKRWSWMVQLMDRANGLLRKLNNRKEAELTETAEKKKQNQPTGTFTQHITPDWLKSLLDGKINYDIFVWRSASVRFLRSVVQPWLAGRMWLRLLYQNEERNPRFFGENGQYPMIVIRK
jgi:SAM-dependent methyltransferase